MLNKDWAHFKSGTDIRGIATEGAPDGAAIDLTDEAVGRIADGFVQWLSQKLGKPAPQLCISLGHDSRLSSQRLQAAVLAPLRAAGCRVLLCGLASTPSMFMTTVDLHCDGAVQLTASHHPFYRNGLKFFTRAGGLEGSDITQLLQYAQDGTAPAPASQPGAVEDCAYMAQYSARLRQMICDGVQAEDAAHPLAGFHIVVDAGNGVGGFYASEVLAPLGADVSGSQFLEPDGHFPNHAPNPEDPAAMDALRQAVLRHRADLGVIFDTDVDRAGLVDHQGEEINRNRLVALAAAVALEGAPGGTIVTDSVTSDGLKVFIEQHLGGKQRRFKRGYRNVIDEALRLNAAGVDCPLAIETSGHAAMRENYFLDDGAYLITKLLIHAAKLRRQGRSLTSLFAALPEPIAAAEIRLPLLVEDFRAAGQAILADLRQCAQRQPHWHIDPDTCEGLRLCFDERAGDGWALLRLSVHDPVMPLNIESNIAGGPTLIASQLYVNLRKHEALDAAPLLHYIYDD